MVERSASSSIIERKKNLASEKCLKIIIILKDTWVIKKKNIYYKIIIIE